MTYREDGTFTQTVTSGVIQLETQGTYRLSKSSLSETTSEVLLTFKGQKLDGSNMRDLIGKTATTELKFLDDDTAQTTADGKTVKMVRVRRQLEK